MTQQTTQSPNMTGHTQTKDAAAHFRELQDIIARGEIAMMSGAEMLVEYIGGDPGGAVSHIYAA